MPPEGRTEEDMFRYMSHRYKAWTVPPHPSTTPASPIS